MGAYAVKTDTLYHTIDSEHPYSEILRNTIVRYMVSGVHHINTQYNLLVQTLETREVSSRQDVPLEHRFEDIGIRRG